MPEHVLVVVAPPGGSGLRDADREALGTAAAYAAQRALPLACAVIGHNVEAAATEVAESGAAVVLVADSETLSAFASGLYVPVAAAAISSTEARVVIVPRGPDVLEFVPRLAAHLNGACISGVTELRVEDDDVAAVASAFGGAARALYRFKAPGPRVLALAPVVAPALERVAVPTAERRELAVPDIAPRVQVVEPAGVVTGPRLEDARIVISGGRGLGAKENYDLVRRLADALGGMPGASRAIVDDGWAEPAQQVGLTGKIVAPDVYFAVGISGASQHLVGCANSRCIVAVNTDPQASIFKFAQYGIVDDGLEVLSALIEFSESN